METDRLGNIFTDPQNGLAFRLRVSNAADTARTLRGILDLDGLSRSTRVAAGSGAVRSAEETPHRSNTTGCWPADADSTGCNGSPRRGPPKTVRCAVIEPSTERDSLFGMNHAFSWEFLLRLSHDAGIRWWRDWSVKWHTIQPQPGEFDFRVPDAQIERVLDAQGQVLVLLPFPSAPWATKPDMEKVKAQAEGSRYLRAAARRRPQARAAR